MFRQGLMLYRKQTSKKDHFQRLHNAEEPGLRVKYPSCKNTLSLTSRLQATLSGRCTTLAGGHHFCLVGLINQRIC